MGSAPNLHEQFHRLVDEHYDSVRQYARFLAGSADASEDIVQEAFLRVHARLASGPLEGDAGKYLRGIVRNLVCDHWRASRRFPQDLVDRLQLLAEEADDDGEASEERRRALRGCIQRLPNVDRRLLTKRYDRGLRVIHIAEESGLNASTVRSRLMRIRQTLKRCVEAALSPGGET